MTKDYKGYKGYKDLLVCKVLLGNKGSRVQLVILDYKGCKG